MELITYLFKVTVCTTVFFAVYKLFLSKLTFFRFNRFYLLSTLIISFIIPALEFTIEKVVYVEPNMVEHQITDYEVPNTAYQKEIIIGAAPKLEEVEPFDWTTLIIPLYGVIVIGLLGVGFWRITRLLSFTRTDAVKMDGLKLIQKSVGFTNCSFFNYVFVDGSQLSRQELDVLIAHESVHAKQYHSLDKLLLMFAKAILWFNPVIYFYNSTLEQLHEYEADEIASSDFGTAGYADLLLRLSISEMNIPLVHNFVKSPMKNRIKMLFNDKSNEAKKLSYLLGLPMLLLLIWGFTFTTVYIPRVRLDNGKAENIVKKVLAKSEMGSDQLSEKKLTITKSRDSIPFRMIGANLGKNPKVTIDGKRYSPKILTKISLKGIRDEIIIGDEIVITTVDHKIIYATKTEIKNAKIASTFNLQKLLVVIPQQQEDGVEYKWIKINANYGHYSSEVPSKSRILFLLDGKKVGQNVLESMSKDFIPNTKGISIIDRRDQEFYDKYAAYANLYDAVVSIPGRKFPAGKELKYRSDSSILDGKNQMLKLIGNAYIEANGTSISGSTIYYNKVKNTARVINASMDDGYSVFQTDSLYYDFNANKGKFYGKNKITF